MLRTLLWVEKDGNRDWYRDCDCDHDDNDVNVVGVVKVPLPLVLVLVVEKARTPEIVRQQLARQNARQQATTTAAVLLAVIRIPLCRRRCFFPAPLSSLAVSDDSFFTRRSGVGAIVIIVLVLSFSLTRRDAAHESSIFLGGLAVS
mmetsp:Transcript_6893/g.14629  ORF Transcript_6893/g.14629 Transcript_6893/m.14629 type:complete len:146 (+) Transcript_6893:2183-2620(+)